MSSSSSSSRLDIWLPTRPPSTPSNKPPPFTPACTPQRPAPLSDRCKARLLHACATPPRLPVSMLVPRGIQQPVWTRLFLETMRQNGPLKPVPYDVDCYTGSLIDLRHPREMLEKLKGLKDKMRTVAGFRDQTLVAGQLLRDLTRSPQCEERSWEYIEQLKNNRELLERPLAVCEKLMMPDCWVKATRSKLAQIQEVLRIAHVRCGAKTRIRAAAEQCERDTEHYTYSTVPPAHDEECFGV